MPVLYIHIVSQSAATQRVPQTCSVSFDNVQLHHNEWQKKTYFFITDISGTIDK